MNKANSPKIPRWARVNTLRTTLADTLAAPQFAGFTAVSTIAELFLDAKKIYYIDPYVPNLLAFPPSTDLTSSQLYLGGQLILQDRSSCLPACLLNPPAGTWSVDATAAPGNKTTHLAALLEKPSAAAVIAFEKDPRRAEVLKKMVTRAGGDACIAIRAGEDFLKADPRSKPLKRVTHLLLDPSCSGSGIVSREEYELIPLTAPEPPGGKKRKRPVKVEKPKPVAIPAEIDPEAEETPMELAANRLASLAEFQRGMVLHAMSFPNARKITYSTCSVHAEENEDVVMAVLASKVARRRGWRVERRDEGTLAAWERRGLVEKCDGDSVIAEACIRCNPIEDGGIGFFAVAFVRDGTVDIAADDEEEVADEAGEDDDAEEWGGFDDEEELEQVAPPPAKKQQKQQQKNTK